MPRQSAVVNHDIIPPSLAIRSMRSSGYRDTAHAVAELIDNSIQAGQGINKLTHVEVICVDAVELVVQRQRRRMKQIVVYDNASGMNADTLRLALQFGNGTHLEEDNQDGIGKFGMGLPNASISQCRHVDVWTWQKGRCLYSYLDIGQVEEGQLREVPEPKEQEMPEDVRRLIKDKIGPHGTVVLWSELDQVRWKSSKAFLENAEFLVGRMYRYFVSNGQAEIRLLAYEDTGRSVKPIHDSYVRPNDPLFVTPGTSCPPPYDTKPAFDLYTEVPIQVRFNGKNHKVKLRFSVVKPEVRDIGGATEIGRHVAKNQGVSLVRAQRELELNDSFHNRADTRERWWGVEVLFEPGLDDVFGVTNTKQAATAFRRMDLDDDAALEGLSPNEYKHLLEESEDPRLAIYEISTQINKTLQTLRAQIDRMKEGSRTKAGVTPAPGSAEDISAKATEARRKKFGDQGESDKEEQKSATERQKDLFDALEARGVSKEEAKQIAVQYVRANVKFLFQEANIPGSAIFDVQSRGGTIVIYINSRHPARAHLFDLLRQADSQPEAPALVALKLLLSAWARMEDEAGEKRRQDLEDIRVHWGTMARDFLQYAAE